MPIDSQHPLYAKHVSDWNDCRAFYDGEKAVKNAGVEYLPKPESASTAEYKAYKERAFFLGAVRGTINGLVGTVDRKAPKVKLPGEMGTSWMYEVTKDLEDLPTFSRKCLTEAFLTGRAGVLVDRGKEENAPVYLVAYRAEDIVNWREDTAGNLTLVVLRESYFADGSDTYEQVTKTRYRELYLDGGAYTQRVWKPKALKGRSAKIEYEAEAPIVPSKLGRALPYIPFVFVGSQTITSSIDDSPVLDLVRKNAEHYRVSADYANALYFVGNPIFYISGIDAPAAKKIVLGSSRAIGLPQEAKAGLVECQGLGLSPIKDKLTTTVQEMAELGARLFEAQKDGVEAAETVKLRQSGQTSVLAVATAAVEQALVKVLGYVADWLGDSPDAVEFELNKEFVEVQPDVPLLDTLIQLAESGYMSWETVFYNLVRCSLVPEDRTEQQERDLIDAKAADDMESAVRAQALLAASGATPPTRKGKTEQPAPAAGE